MHKIILLSNISSNTNVLYFYLLLMSYRFDPYFSPHSYVMLCLNSNFDLYWNVAISMEFLRENFAQAVKSEILTFYPKLLLNCIFEPILPPIFPCGVMPGVKYWKVQKTNVTNDFPIIKLV